MKVADKEKTPIVMCTTCKKAYTKSTIENPVWKDHFCSSRCWDKWFKGGELDEYNKSYLRYLDAGGEDYD